MGERSFRACAVRWLRRSVQPDGLVHVAIGGRSKPVVDRFVVILLAAGVLQPVGLSVRDSQPDQITYAVVGDDDGDGGLSPRVEGTERTRGR